MKIDPAPNRWNAVFIPIAHASEAEHLFHPTHDGCLMGSGVKVMGSDPIKILIVDDDERVLIELERLLEGEGYITATAWGGRQALELSETTRFDLVLVDEHVGDLEPAALLEGLKQRQPRAFQILMHTHRGQKPNGGVCKWEHADMKDRIRRYIAA